MTLKEEHDHDQMEQITNVLSLTESDLDCDVEISYVLINSSQLRLKMFADSFIDEALHYLSEPT